MVKKACLALVTLILTDLLCAQVAKHLVPGWDAQGQERQYRVSSKLYNHDLAPMVDTWGVWGARRYRIRTNSLGFKDKTNREVPLQAGGRRIVLIGDSFTEGVGMEFQDTFAGIVAAELAKQGIDVLNAGVGTYAPAIYYRKTKYLLEDRGLKFDELVVFIDISDIQDEAYLYEIQDDRVVMSPPKNGVEVWVYNPGTSLADRFKSFLKTNSIVVRMADTVKDALRPAQQAAAEPRPAQDPGAPPALNVARALWTVDDAIFDEYGRKGVENAERDMDKLAAVLAQHRVGLTVVVYPWPDQVARGDRRSKQVKVWRAWARRTHSRFVNLFPPFFHRPSKEALASYFIPGDVHYNEAGEQLVAAQFLKRWRKLPPSRSH